MLNTMRYKEGFNKQQTKLMPKNPDQCIPQNHICRVIHAFTQTLDMQKLGYKYATPNQTGNKPYNPQTMLNLYLYGYLHRIRSSRRLQAETTKNIEIMWLLNEHTPDDKTIANFRSDNAKALKQTFHTFTLMLNNAGLYGKETQATDGTKFRANNSRKNNHNPTTLKTKIANIDKQITEHLNAIEKNDKKENKTKESNTDLPSPQECQDLLLKLKNKKVDLEKLLAKAEKEGEVSTVDPDARLMHSGRDARPLDVCYNAITITDAKHKLIVDFEVTNKPSDSGSLQTMSEKAKEVMGVKALTNLADKGFYDGADILACEQKGIKCLVAKTLTRGPKKTAGFKREQFSYDAALDCYVCPCGHQMHFRRMVRYRGGRGEQGRVYENYAACRLCQRRLECTRGHFRVIVRSPYQDVLDVVDMRTANNAAFYRQRCEVVEHPFGVVKAV
jgi:transposase